MSYGNVRAQHASNLESLLFFRIWFFTKSGFNWNWGRGDNEGYPENHIIGWRSATIFESNIYMILRFTWSRWPIQFPDIRTVHADVSAEALMHGFSGDVSLIPSGEQKKEGYRQTDLFNGKFLEKAHILLLFGWLVFLVASCLGLWGIVLIGSANTTRPVLLGMALVTLAFFLSQYAFPLMGI
jgi:hypothetical protein